MNYELISFDCYGTLVDWKEGVLKELVQLLEEFQIEISREEIFNLFLELDAELESDSYQNYKNILKSIMEGFSKKLGLNLLDDDLTILSRSLTKWNVFPDTIASLKALKEKYKLAVISNIDIDLFKDTNRQLEIEFDYIITAEDLKSYKPSHKNFNAALEIFDIKKENILHCAQSLYHDIIPCNELGINNVWINRYMEDKPGSLLKKPGKEFDSLSDLSNYLLK